MTLQIKTTGKIIRELIESERTPSTITPKLDPILVDKILKKKEKTITKYRDIDGVEFYIGSKYHDYRVDDIVVCTYSKFDRNKNMTLNAGVGDFFPVYQDRIIKLNGTLTGFDWDKFINKHQFQLVGKKET